MSETLRDHTLAWLDSIGADGLMYTHPTYKWVIVYEKTKETKLRSGVAEWGLELVPAFRHADGSYHTEPGCCIGCTDPLQKILIDCHCSACPKYTQWLAHKETK